MKTLYQVTWIEHTRGAKNKASLQGVATSDWANARLYDRLATVLATSPQDAARQLQEMILPRDPRPLSCTSYLPQFAVKPLRVGQEVVCPAHGRWYEEREDGGLREGTWTHGVVAELLGDDPATATAGLHLYRETVTGSGRPKTPAATGTRDRRASGSRSTSRFGNSSGSSRKKHYKRTGYC